MTDYVPSSDGEFAAWLRNLAAYVTAHFAELGLGADDMDALTYWSEEFPISLDALVAAQAEAAAKRQAKDEMRSGAEEAVRGIVRRIQAAPGVTDAQRQALGIMVRDSTPTAAGAPTTRPVVSVEAGQRLRHMIHFAETGKKGKPAGVMGCEVWMKITAAGAAAPVDPSELSFLALDTRTPYIAEYDGADAGKTAHYMLRWVNTRGDKGPWSETISATIAG